MNKQDTGYIYAQYRDKVFGFVRSKVFRSEDVEDLVQEVFLKVYANLDRYDEVKASLSTWIYTITRNTVYDYLKAKRDRPVFELLDNTEDATDEAPDEELLRNETLEELACALEKHRRADARDSPSLYGLCYRAVQQEFCTAVGQLVSRPRRVVHGTHH